jgi:hypothetical protein
MEPENLDIESIMDARREAVEQTIQPIGIDRTQVARRESLSVLRPSLASHVLKENSGSTVYSATTNDQIEVLYCPDKEAGMWFLPQGGVGLLQARELGILKEIIEKQ